MLQLFSELNQRLTLNPRFFFADERKPNGDTVGFDVSGESHVPVYLELVKGGDDLPYYVTFAEGKIVKFKI